MSLPAKSDPQQVAMLELRARSGATTEARGVAAAAAAAYDDLARVLVPLIGQGGVDALTSRAIHLLNQRNGSKAQIEKLTPAKSFGGVTEALERMEKTHATEAAAMALAFLIELLVTFIGEGLTTRLLRKTWPHGFSDSTAEEQPA